VLKHLRSSRDDRTLWERGFTLVELLVVIVILGILAAVVVFAVGGTEQNAKVKSCLAERNTLEAAVISYQSAAESNPDLPPGVSINALENATPAFLKHNPKYWTVNNDGSLTRQGTDPPLNLCDNNTNG
jgi:general secretion pathway protein G